MIHYRDYTIKHNANKFEVAYSLHKTIFLSAWKCTETIPENNERQTHF